MWVADINHVLDPLSLVDNTSLFGLGVEDMYHT